MATHREHACTCIPNNLISRPKQYLATQQKKVYASSGRDKIYWIDVLANYLKSELMERARFYVIILPLTSRLDKWEDTKRGTNGRLQLFLD
jgi:hypothetical protein